MNASSGKHTPGPWHVGNSGRFLICTLTQKVKVYADEMVHTDAPTDARLIAAAPDLLDALIALLASVEGVPCGPEEQCRAAIARATGAKT